MPSFSIHIACANEFIKQSKIDNPVEFMKGIIAVDTAQDKYVSHYSETSDTSDLKRYLTGKVNIENYLKENDVTTDYDRGYLFHLLTDYYFYTTFFNDDYISNVSYTEFKKTLHHDYNAINEYLKAKYNVVYPEEIKKWDISIDEEPIELKPDLLDSFVEKIASIDLETIKLSKYR